MNSMEELFEQIIHSENAAKERNSFIKELKRGIQDGEQKNKILQKEGIVLRSQLDQKVAELSDKQLTAKWLTCQETIYKDQMNELAQQLGDLKQKEQELYQRRDGARLKFCEECHAFSKDFSLGGNGAAKREEICGTELKELLEREARLQQSKQAHTEKRERLEGLKKEMDTLGVQLQETLEEADKQASSISEEERQTAALEKELLTLTNRPRTDPEFLSLDAKMYSFQSKLDHEKSRSVQLDDQCRRLQDELESLQQACMQKRIRTHQRQNQMPGRRITIQATGVVAPSRISHTMTNDKGASEEYANDIRDSFTDSCPEFDSMEISPHADKHTTFQPASAVQEGGEEGGRSMEQSAKTWNQNSQRTYIFKSKTLPGTGNAN